MLPDLEDRICLPLRAGTEQGEDERVDGKVFYFRMNLHSKKVLESGNGEILIQTIY